LTIFIQPFFVNVISGPFAKSDGRRTTIIEWLEVLEENKKFRLASVYNQRMAEGGKDNSLQHTHF
jgi:hypothetical protein